MGKGGLDHDISGILEPVAQSQTRLPWRSSVILFEGWRYFPFAFLFILARLQGIPDELYHAASVDGASPFQRFFHITLPQLGTVLATLFLFRFIWTINKFDDIFLLTRGQGGVPLCQAFCSSQTTAANWPVSNIRYLFFDNSSSSTCE